MSAIAEAFRAEPDPLASFDLDTLLDGAARLRADRFGLSDTVEKITFGEADRRASALAVFFGELGLSPGESILLATGAPAASFLALVGAIRAGLQVALAPGWTDQTAAARMAALSGAAAIIVASTDLAFAPDIDWLPIAATTASVRLICSLGSEKIDGVVSIDLAALPTGRRTRDADADSPRIVTFEGGVKPIAHHQRAIVAAALDLVARARIGMRLPVISTIAPATFAGLSAGPVASLIAGAGLHWEAPFDARRFVAKLDETAPAHLVAPAALSPMLLRAGLLSSGQLASLLLLSRYPAADSGKSLPASLAVSQEKQPSIVDLFAFGERTVVPEARYAQEVVPAASEPHYLDLDGSQLLAVGWSNESGRPELRGAAVSTA